MCEDHNLQAPAIPTPSKVFLLFNGGTRKTGLGWENKSRNINKAFTDARFEAHRNLANFTFLLES